MRGLLLFTLILTNPLPVTAFAQQPEQQRVIHTLVEMWQAIEKGDLERYAEFLHPAYTAFGEGDVYLLEGRDQELRSMRRYLERASGVHTEMHQPVVRIEGWPGLSITGVTKDRLKESVSPAVASPPASS